MKCIYWPNVCPLQLKKMASYTGDNMLSCFDVVGKPDLQVLNTVKDVVTNDMEC